MTETTARTTWEAENTAYLERGFAWLRARLTGSTDEAEWWDEPRWSEDARPPALEMLGFAFGMSRFERLALLLVAGVELDPQLAQLCQGSQLPSFALAMHLLPEPRWDVMSAHRPLRYWRLVETRGPADQPLLTNPLAADPRIVGYLRGLNELDERLSFLVRPVERALGQPLPPSHELAILDALSAWPEPLANEPVAAIQLLGNDEEVLRGIAAEVASEAGRWLFELVVERLPGGAEASELSRLWQRETLMLSLALYVDVTELDRPEHTALASWLGDLKTAVIVGAREPWPIPRTGLRLVDARRPTADEQQDLWVQALSTNDAALDRETVAVVDHIAAQLSGRLDLNQRDISRAAESARREEVTFECVWRTCQAQSRPRLEALATHVRSNATWQDLVLPPNERNLLRHIVDQVKGRSRVLRSWGLGDATIRGSGVTALFAGQSGTGKSLAAEVLANELSLSLFRIDLAGVVSKYIGETERNLRRVFDAADQGGALLLFDEADALFGKRSTVKDAHDRYANIEVSYLLQRMDDYRGVAILTTNQRHALDHAFLRRLRFVVSFPFPSETERLDLWGRAFPRAAGGGPTGRGREDPHGIDVDIDVRRLAELAATGGMIRNIALNAAYCAAGRGVAITTELVLQLAQLEFQKLDLPANDRDFALTSRRTP